jgi:hypothetical protein
MILLFEFYYAFKLCLLDLVDRVKDMSQQRVDCVEIYHQNLLHAPCLILPTFGMSQCLQFLQ